MNNDIKILEEMTKGAAAADANDFSDFSAEYQRARQLIDKGV